MVTVRAVAYVKASDLFQGFEGLHDLFCNSDPDFSWGDNQHSLVCSWDIVNIIKYYTDELNEDKLKSFKERCNQLGWPLVDLET